MKGLEQELLNDNWVQVRPDIEVKQVAIPRGEETYILCRTAGRKEKEQAIRKRFSARMEKALRALEQNIARGRLKDRNKMERQLGRIQARHPQVHDLFAVELRDTPHGVRLFGKPEPIAWPGGTCVKAPICCAPICAWIDPKNCGPSTCN